MFDKEKVLFLIKKSVPVWTIYSKAQGHHPDTFTFCILTLTYLQKALKVAH